MGTIARCWMAEGFSKSWRGQYAANTLRTRRLTVCVDAAQQILLQTQVVERGDDRNGLGRFKYEFLYHL